MVMVLVHTGKKRMVLLEAPLPYLLMLQLGLLILSKMSFLLNLRLVIYIVLKLERTQYYKL